MTIQHCLLNSLRTSRYWTAILLHENGQLAMELKLKNGLKAGVVKMFYKKRTAVNEGELQEGPRKGFFTGITKTDSCQRKGISKMTRQKVWKEYP